MLRPKRKSSDFSDEIQSHIQLEAERLREEDARAARRAARVDAASTLRHD